MYLLFFAVALRLLNTVMDKMLPEKLQNLDEDLILEDIIKEMELKTEFENKMNAHLGISNVTNYKEKASQVFLVRQHVRSIQQTQVNLVSPTLSASRLRLAKNSYKSSKKQKSFYLYLTSIKVANS